MKLSKLLVSALVAAMHLSACGSLHQQGTETQQDAAPASDGGGQGTVAQCPLPTARADGKRFPQLVGLSRIYREESFKYEGAKQLFDARTRTGQEPEDLKHIHPHALEEAIADMPDYRRYLDQITRAQSKCFVGTLDAELECLAPVRPQLSGFDFFYSILQHIVRSEVTKAPECKEAM